MKARARTAVIVVLSVLAAAALGLWLWLPWDPFEADAGPLDAWVPADADAVVRLDAGALQRAPVARTLWNGPAGRRLRDALGLAGLAQKLRAADDRLAALPGVPGDPPTVAGDFLGREVLIAVRDDDVVALARLSGRAKAIDLLRRAGERRLSEWGIDFDAEDACYEVTDGDAAGVRFARRRDVLIVATAADLFDDVLALAGGRGESITSNAAYRAAALAAPADARIDAWATGTAAARIAKVLPFAAHAVRAALDHPVRAQIDLTGRDSVRATVRLRGEPKALFDVSGVAAGAARLSGGSFASGALPLTAQDVVAALFDSQPPARRKLVDGLLAENGSSARRVVDDVAAHLADGVAFAVTRLPATDSIRLDDAEGDVRIPVPATIVLFRLKDADPEPLLADLRRHAEALFGRGAVLDEERFAGGARLFRVRDTAPFGPEWALVRPALAIDAGQAIFSSNDQALVAALAARAPGGAVSADAWVAVDFPRLHRRVLDLRWDAADRASAHDWAAEREQIRRVQRIASDPLTPQELRRLEDAEIERRVRERREIEFPEELRRYTESVAWLEGFTRGEARCVAEGDAVRIEATVGVRVP
jgi:hypothetical protein